MCVGDGFEGWEDGVHLGRSDQADRVEKFQFLVGWSVPGVDSGTRGLGGAYCLDGAERPGAHGKLQLARGRHGEAGLFLCKEVNLYLMPVNCTK